MFACAIICEIAAVVACAATVGKASHRSILLCKRRGKLAATCTVLRAAGGRWFSGTVVRVWTGNSRWTELTRWLEERQGVQCSGPEQINKQSAWVAACM